MKAERSVTKVLPVIPEEITTSSSGITIIIRYNEMFPFGSVGGYHVTLIDVPLIATKLSGLTPAGAASKEHIHIIHVYSYEV